MPPNRVVGAFLPSRCQRPWVFSSIPISIYYLGNGSPHPQKESVAGHDSHRVLWARLGSYTLQGRKLLIRMRQENRFKGEKLLLRIGRGLGYLPVCRSIGEHTMSMKTKLLSLWREERGQDIAEYAVMLAVILVIVVGTIRLIGSNANNVFSSVGSSLQ